MTTAICPAIPRDPGGCTTSAARPWPSTIARALVLCLVFSIIFLPEYARDATAFGPAYAKAAGGFRFIDLALLLLVFCHVVGLGCSRRRQVRFPHSLAIPGSAFLLCIVAGIAHGAARGGGNFFFDWRALALGIGLYFVWSFWLQNSADAAAAVRLFGLYAAVRIALLFGLYVAGFRDTLLGVSIPIYDGPVLSCIVFAGPVAMCRPQIRGGRGERLLWSWLAPAACFLVLLCLRRTYWGELAIGTVILLLVRKRNRVRNLALLLVAVIAAAGFLGGPFSSRIQSLDVSREDTRFSASNADHVHDLGDAWDQIGQSPLLGIGVGTSYATWQIRAWKTESVMVHNAPLHVWLKYGLAGLVCYLWFHVALLRWLYRRSKAAAFCAPAFAYLAAQFLMTLGFAPWPYSELQLTTLISFIIAVAVASGEPSALPSGL
ncbi:MAG TPA: O-antigen ligase family protein [Candidatus Binatia bacterium]|nr:O-antigen ligase family protein [Candidatus Binatia bacterium]